jgi:hypothetical protein
VVAGEIVGVQEEADPSAGLVADPGCLALPRGTGLLLARATGESSS